MKRGILLSMASFFIMNYAIGQSHVGLGAGYKFVDYPNWSNKSILNSQIGEVADFKNHVFFGIEYVKQLKKSSLNALVVLLNVDKSLASRSYANMSNISIQTGYRLYPFNQQDCDCPSFYQTGSIFSRGFNMTPRLGANLLKIKNQSSQLQIIGGVDLSLDIPLSKITGISPFVGISLTSYATNNQLIESDNLSNANSLLLGVKVIHTLPNRQYRYR
jgi:hypothetical protein